jgi:hypothetical protein
MIPIRARSVRSLGMILSWNIWFLDMVTWIK